MEWEGVGFLTEVIWAWSVLKPICMSAHFNIYALLCILNRSIDVTVVTEEAVISV